MDPISDVFRTMHITAFGQHRLEATAPWGLVQEKQAEERVPPSGKKISPMDVAHFAMLSRGSCWLSVDGISDQIPLTGGDCFLLDRDTSIVMRDSPANTPEVNVQRGRRTRERQCRSLWGRWCTNDHRLWILPF